ncbi:MAG: hypothetical protein RL885_06795 [Planctomycetota bacterium]
MNGLKAHLWKEWRDRKAILIGIAIGLPIFDLVTLALLGERLARVSGDPGDATYSFECVIALLAALAVFVFTIAADLFGTERRQGTLTLLQRVPGAALRAFCVKVVFLAATLLGMIAWQLISLMLAWLCLGEPHHAWLVAETIWSVSLLSEGALFVEAAILLLCVWIALVSTWIPRSGAATVAGLILFAIYWGPLWYIKDHYPGFWPMTFSQANWLIFSALGLTIILLAASFLAWSRYARSGLASAWRSLTIVTILAGTGYALGGKSIHDFFEIDPREETLRISRAVIGTTEEYALVEVHKQHESVSFDFEHLFSGENWLIDLRSGEWSFVAQYQWAMSGEPFAIYPRDFEPVLDFSVESPENPIVNWVDLRTMRRLGPTGLYSNESWKYWAQVGLRASWQRDSSGRKVASGWGRSFGKRTAHHGWHTSERLRRVGPSSPTAG